MTNSLDLSSAPSSFRRYAFFGFVDVQHESKGPSVSSAISIVDNFSLEQTRLTILESAKVDTVGFTDDCIFFFLSQSGAIYGYKKKTLFHIQRSSAGQTWEWIPAQVSLQRSRIDTSVQSCISKQWSHWDEWMREQLPSSEGSISRFLVCSMHAAFLVENKQDMTSTLERIRDSRPMKQTERTKVLDFTVKQVCAGNDHLVFLDTTGAVHTCGTGTRGELGHDALDSQTQPKQIEMFQEAELSIVQIAVGGWHSCALTTDGDVYGWGWNNCGQLGYAADEFSIRASPYPFDVDQQVVAIACRNNSTFLKLEDGSTLSFGEVGGG